jgi:hypothetical protein
MQDQRQLFGYIASGVLALATFLPIATLPLVGSLNYFSNGQGDGVFVLLAAIAAGLLVALKKYKFVLIPAGIAAAVTLYTLISLMIRINELQASLGSDLEGNPFAGLAEGLAASVRLEWGWIILILAEVALVLIALNVIPKAKPAE